MAQRKVNCEVYTDRGIVGKDGADGKSAYQQAVEGGYQGTEEEFEQALASDIATVANNVTNINVVGNNIENVNTVAGNATNINTVATNISSINTAATNMPAIISAPTEAANAANSATEASASATIATTQAELAKEYASIIDMSNYRTSADQDIIDATKATKAELAGYLPLASKAVANGVASLDANGKVPTEQIPVATTSALGGVKPDGTTITVTEDGTISAAAGSGTAGLSIGDVVYSYSSLSSENPGKLPLFTGETIASANTIYPEFYNWVSAHTELQCTSAEYESALTTYGECAKYVIGSGSLRLPLIKNYIKAANPSEGIKNIEAGLPDHNHTVSGSSNWGSLSHTGNDVALVTQVTTSNASSSNPIYGKSSTVTPASTTLYPWVVAYTAAIPASTAQAAQFQQGLSGKADTNLGNIPSNYDYVVESYKDDQGNWYRKYKSGWLEQGGIYTSSVGNNVKVTVNLLKPYLNTNYNICITLNRSNVGDSGIPVIYGSPTATTFVYMNDGINDELGFRWGTCGQGA